VPTLAIAEVWHETEDALGIAFDVPPDLADDFRFEPGQYVTLETGIDGERVRRSYSICAPAGGRLEIAVKRIGGGVFSEHLHAHARPGLRLDVAPPQGSFVHHVDPARAQRYLMIAAGSGITPIVSLVESILAGEPESFVTLIYGNRRTATTMFRDKLSWLKNAYMERFQWINILSREAQDAEILNGRIDNRKGAALNRRLIRIRGFDEFFLCGPEAMISEVSRGLRGEGIDESRIHYELFFASAEDARAVVAKHHDRATRYGGQIFDVVVRAGGRAVALEIAADGSNILDAALDAGLDVPFSCKGGVCATCKARLVEGRVDMDLNHVLAAAELDAGWVLTCQSHPITPRVVVDFDTG
jgi:ring-1,2-phenylacetyl-CoA epoxidase subunit PaaE